MSCCNKSASDQPFLGGDRQGNAEADFARWMTAHRKPSLARQVERDAHLAEARRIYFTPAFLIGPTGGPAKPLLHFTFTETPAFDEAIERLLRA
jgi:hypothetical protein